MNEIVQRLFEILSKKGEGRGAFAQRAGISPAVLSHVASGRNAPSLDLVLATLKLYPDVSPEWLLLGKGSWNRTEVKSSQSTPLEPQQLPKDLFSAKQESTTETPKEFHQPAISADTVEIMRKIEELRFLLKLHSKNAEDSITELEHQLRSINDSRHKS